MIRWIKELRSTERGKTLFKFSLYLLFFFFVIILCLVAGAMEGPSTNYSKDTSYRDSTNSHEKEEADKAKTYFEKQELFKGKYEYNYEIVLKEKTVHFIGKYDFGKSEGFKEDEQSLIHYIIEEGTTYKVNIGSREEITNLYEGLDESLFDFEKLFIKLNDTSALIDRTDDLKTYSYTLENRTYKIVTNEAYIEKIDISDGETQYHLEFQF